MRPGWLPWTIHISNVWGNADAYEAYIGRWSRPVAQAFLTWMAPAPGGCWVDVGCGTGALTQVILTAGRAAGRSRR